MKKIQIQEQFLFPIGIGTWQIGDNSRKAAKEIEAIRCGIDAGAQLIDTAESYGYGRSESLIGQAIRDYDRASLYLVSKVLPENASQKKLPLSLEQTLEHLQTDYLDLYLLHWKSSIPLVETIASMEEMKAQGKIKAWGVSNFDINDMEALRLLPYGQHCLTNQVKYNLIYRGIEFDLIPYLQAHHMPLMAYSPVVKGKTQRFSPQQADVLNTIAQQQQATVPQILLAWSIRDGNTIAIPKASSPEHMLENIEAAHISLTTTELALLDTVFPPPQEKETLALW